MQNKTLGFWLGLAVLLGGAFAFWTSAGIGQVPTERLARQEITRPNPLRANQPQPVPGAIRQTAHNNEDGQLQNAVSPIVPPPNLGDPFGASLSSPIAIPTVATPAAVSEGHVAFDESMLVPAAAPPAQLSGSALPGSTLPGGEANMLHEQPGLPLLESQPMPPSLLEVPSAPELQLSQESLHTPLGNMSLSHADPFAMEQSEVMVPSYAVQHDLPTPLLEHTIAYPNESVRTAAIIPIAPVASSQTMQSQSHHEGTGFPGTSSLEGVQTPHLAIQKVFPDEVVIERPVTIKTVIQNVGNSIAKNVSISDRVPQGTRLISTIPEAVHTQDGELRWSVGNLDPNVQLVIEMKVMPLREGEIGSIASVSYTGEASGRIAVTRPMLKVEVNAPAEVRLGEIAQVEIIISNPGTATATNLVVEERVPEGLFHRDGRVMRHEGITALGPKESKKLTLPLLCTGSGNLVNHVIVTADGNLMVEDKTTIRALAPVLELEIVGTQNRFLERRSDYRLIVANKGNAAARNVALELSLPAAVQFVSTNQSGVYDESSHSVHWALEELPAQEAGEIELVIMPMQKGTHPLRFTGSGENNLRAESALSMNIDGIPAVAFDISSESNLVELGKDAVYEIRVSNRGTKAAENVRVRVTLAEGMSFVKAEGGRYQAAQGGIIQFETIPQLTARGESVYRVTARSQMEGDHRLNVQVISDDLRIPITKEESTRVFR